MNCRTQAQACQDKIAKQNKQITVLIAALKKARGIAADMDNADDADDGAPEVSSRLQSDLTSVRARTDNMLEIAEKGFNRSNKATFMKYLGRAESRAENALKAAGRGDSQEKREAQSMLDRFKNIRKVMNGLEGTVSTNQVEDVTKTVVEQLIRIKDRAEGASTGRSSRRSNTVQF